MRLRKRKVDGTNVASALIEGHNERHALALVDPLGVIEHVRYVELAVQATRWAELLRLHGVGPGDRVVVLAGSNRESHAALLGAVEVGAAAVPVSAEAPVEEIRAIAETAGAAHIASAAPRPDVADGFGFVLLSADRLHPSIDSDEEAYVPQPDDAALVLDERGRSVVHTHESLLAQADTGVHWLGVGAGERVWVTAPEGSAESIWLLLAAWRSGAEIVRLDRELRPDEQLELLVRLAPSAVWLSDDEYRALASIDVQPWLVLSGLRRALTSGEPGEGAAAFHELFGVAVAPVYGTAETGVFASAPPGEHLSVAGIGLAVVDSSGNELAPGREGDLVLPADAPTLPAGHAGDWFRLGLRGAIDPDGMLRFASGEAPRLEPAPEPEPEPDVTAGLAVVTAEPDRRAEKREAKERERARREEERRAKQEAKAEAKAREEAERATRAAAQAEERKRAEAAKAEEQRLRAEAKEREEAERTERRRRAEEAALAEKTAAEERRRALEAEQAAKADERRRAEEAQRLDDERRREEQLRAAAAEPAKPEEPARERLAPDVLSTLSHYGMASPTDPDLRREPMPPRDQIVSEPATE
jgi:hypothetical protein